MENEGLRVLPDQLTRRDARSEANRGVFESPVRGEREEYNTRLTTFGIDFIFDG